jgi:hypothetical protein
MAAFARPETGISLSGDENPANSEQFLDSLCNTPKQQTGWWRMQSSETGLQGQISSIREVLTRYHPTSAPPPEADQQVSNTRCS